MVEPGKKEVKEEEDQGGIGGGGGGGEEAERRMSHLLIRNVRETDEGMYRWAAGKGAT